eukprot:COSAG01_NODE_51016_length_358_cov_0.969112_1_plen_84_part_10
MHQSRSAATAFHTAAATSPATSRANAARSNANTTADTVGRGAEFSALELFEGRLLTMDDRTASLVEIVVAGSGSSGERLLQLEP